MNRVFVLDTNRQPLMLAHPARARRLLRSSRASVFRKVPFTIILHDCTAADSDAQPVRTKVDPGSKTTGLALVADFADRGSTVVWAGELHHRGEAIRKALADRRAHRRNRRARKTRYRKPRFQNRRRIVGWLPPSVAHRVATTRTWIDRLRRWSPVTALSLERVKFDTQLLEDPNIAGAEYQQGSLQGYEFRAYLLARHCHTCAYCGGLSGDPVLEREHVQPRSRGGSDRVANQVIACTTCNRAKGNRTAGKWAESLGGRTKLDRTRKANAEAVQAGQRPSLRDATAVNAVRNALAGAFQATGLPVEWGRGGRTKYNRTCLGYPKATGSTPPVWARAGRRCGSIPTLHRWESPLPATASANGLGSTATGSPGGTNPGHGLFRAFEQGTGSERYPASAGGSVGGSVSASGRALW